MLVPAIKDLSQLSDPAFFTEVAVGLDLIIANARRLHASASTLADAGHFHGAQVLQALSEEEASKYLILIDAVRCPRQPGDRFAAQLARFNDHLAKGLYAEACAMRPSTLGELQEFLNPYREEFYLDGPNDVDWVFRNLINHQRERTLYVDYVKYDGGHTWLDPGRYDDPTLTFFTRTEPGTLQIAGLLHDVGISTADAVATLAQLWRSVEMVPEMRWMQLRALNCDTLERLNSRNLLQERSDSDYQKLVDEWLFPLYTLDLRLRAVKKESLRQTQRLWSAQW